ncbi:DinB family protein [Anatilimnocola aggregata]|uniref:DinB family protein n=1 Tax=Anatilimnocola aggregata TaxID=2528021 RepID=A0A517Y5X1_9BACT|nr:DinB family protein [Anatilimnocola aggregata]QDU25634.1 DinB family protein [Anatilimnocola aggregata]
MKPYLQRMFRYVAWADQRTLATVRVTAAAQAEALPLMAHLLAAEHVWLSRLQQREPRHAVWPALTLDECEQLAAENEAGYCEFLENLAENHLIDMKHYRNAAGQEFATLVIDILTQVIAHGPYHRGQIAKIIGRHGGTVPSTDFIIFTREGG